MNDAPLIVITGPTASGKTSLAIDLAEKFSGEIICADSRTVYAGMDVGTAKPSQAERDRVSHWGLDLVEPGEPFSVADFQAYAYNKINEIRARHRVPFLVGGSGLYIDAVIFDYQFGPPADPAERAALAKLTLEQLHEYCKKNHIPLPENASNKRYVIRAIEQKSINVKRRSRPQANTIIVGIATDREILRERIAGRAEQLFDNGVVEEATILGKKYGWNNEAMTGNIYPLVHRYLRNELSMAEVKEKFTTLDWRLAKRQLTWLRRNSFIHWGSLAEVEQYITEKLVTK